MAVKELNAKEQHYADTREEAEKLVEETKEDLYVTSWKISEKHNKYGTYFLVDLAFTYDTAKEIMESTPSPKVETTEHEGVPYEVNADGTVSVPEGQLSIDELNEESEDEE